MELNSKEIRAIIRTASQSGVRTLELAELKLEFGLKRHETRTSPPSNASEVVPEDPEQTEKVRKEADAQDQLQDAEDRVAELLLADPERYEDMLASGELEDGDEQPEPTEKEI